METIRIGSPLHASRWAIGGWTGIGVAVCVIKAPSW